jgi:hypothetical protein
VGEVNLTIYPEKPCVYKQVYFLRISVKHIGEVTFREIYNTIRLIKASFRIMKTDPELHPVFYKNYEKTIWVKSNFSLGSI